MQTKKQIEERMEDKIDKWLDTSEHSYNCASHSEGFACCLDKTEDGLIYGGKGRKFIKSLFFEEIEKVILDLVGEEEKETEDEYWNYYEQGYNKKRQEILDKAKDNNLIK